MEKLNKKNSIILAIVIILALAILSGLIAYILLSNNEANDIKKIYYVGDTQICGDYEVTITEYEVLHKIYDVNGEYAKGNYLVIYYDIKNISNKTQNLYKDNFKVVNQNGSEYDTVAIFQKSIDGYHHNNNIEIPSGITISSKIYFDIAETEKLKFLFGEWGFFKEEVYSFQNK